MAKQTFTTGQVLTAAQLTSLQQTAMGGGSATTKTASYVLVAADAGTTITMTSASATTITVNTALFAAGDTVYIQNLGAGVCTITAGTATVNTSATLALAQYEGGQLYFNSTSAAIFVKGAGAAAASGANFTLLNSGGTALTGAATITVSGISGKDKIAIVVTDASSASASSTISIRLNTDTGANYYTYGNRNTGSTAYSSDNIRGWAAGSDQNSIRLGVMSSLAAGTVYGFCLLTGCNSSGVKMIQATGGGLPDGSNSQQIYNIGGYYDSSSTISSISVFSASGNFDAGTVYVYTSA